MWLDRFSGKDTTSGSPPPQNRSYSPRRPSHLGPGAATRPSFSPRSSSLQLGLKSNASTTSISSSRIPNGSTLKQQITPPADVADPLEVLAEIVGGTLPRDGLENEIKEADVSMRPSILVEKVEFNGLGLDEFVQEVGNKGDGSNSVSQAVDEYNEEKDRFEDLHRSILACDEVLRSVESSLTSFQKDLGAVSAEIETLQSRSTALNTKLENRKVVEKLLGPAVEDIAIAPAVVKIISEGPIDLSWVKALDELERRSKALESKIQGPEAIMAIADLKPLYDNLTCKAVERIRDFFVSLIKGLRSPSINAQIIQQQSFLRYKSLYAFLMTHRTKLAEEIGQAYINTMRWYYQSHFMRYRQTLENISLYTVDKQYTLGGDQNAQKGNLSAKASQISQDPLSIGRRMDIFKRVSQSALTSYLASEDHQTHHLEVPFLNFNLALLDNATFEFTFLTTFFPQSSSTATLSQKFAAIFTPTFALGHAFTKSLVDSSYDCLGILLCVRLNQNFAFELQRRKCPAVDPYINGTNMLLWPRFQLAMDMHAESLRRAAATLPSSNRTLTLTANSASHQSTAPHMLTQRFGNFLQGILALSADTGDDSEPVGRSLERLRAEVEVFLNRVGKGLSAAKREQFLANNWSLVLTIMGDVDGRLAAEMKAYFEGLRG